MKNLPFTIRILVVSMLMGSALLLGSRSTGAEFRNGEPLVHPTSPAAMPATVEVIAIGLNNPRGLNFDRDGNLYVAEAGNGGTIPCGTGAEPPFPPFFYGPSGSITKIDVEDNTYERVITGLPSRSAVGGDGALGPHDIVWPSRGEALITTGFGADPRTRTTACGTAGRNFARLISARRNGSWTPRADLGAYEIAANPHPVAIDSNPYGIAATRDDREHDDDFAGGTKPALNQGRGGHDDDDDEDGNDNTTVLVDAGGNDLLAVAPNGRVSTLAVFQNRMVPFAGNMVSMQAVPTTVAKGRDGRYYVGQLTGFPFPPGGANVYRIPSHGGMPQVYASGFTNIIDIAFGRDGSLYILEIDANGLLVSGPLGALIKISPNGTRTEIAPGALTLPGGLAISRTGVIYVTNFSTRNGLGEVLRITE